MKQRICLVLAMIFVVLTMFSCRNSKPQPTPIERVEELIEKLSPYADDAYIKIDTVNRDYNALSEEEKQEVKNYDRFLLAKEIYNYRRIKENASEEAKKNVSRNLLNPSSMQVNSCNTDIYKTENGDFYVKVKLDYSAQNKLGGYARATQEDYYLYQPPKDGWAYISSGERIGVVTYKLGIANLEYYWCPSWN